MQVERVDFVVVPTRDAPRAFEFYVETLGLRPDAHANGPRWYEAWVGDTCFAFWAPESMGMPFAPSEHGTIALRVPDVGAARAELESKGVEFYGETIDSGVCHMAFFHDPDGNALMLHRRYAPYE